MTFFRSGSPRRFAAVVLIAVSGLSLAACQQKQANLDGADSMSTGSTSPASFQNTAKLGQAWQSDPTNVNKGLAYANGLAAIGQTGQQLDVLQKLSQSNPGDTALATMYGKKLIAAGKSSDAVPVLESAAASPSADWRVYSALGAAYDQQEMYPKAQASYDKALQLKPNELSVLNNLGMSYALQGKLKEAEATLRKAMALPGASSQPRIRQNLALVLGLQGRFDEAKKIASEDLPPYQVEANMQYLQQMLSRPNTWQQLSNAKQG